MLPLCGENPTATGLSSAVPDTVHISAAVARSSQGCDCVPCRRAVYSLCLNFGFFLLPIFSKWLTLPLKPSSENLDFAHCSVPKSAKTVDTRWAQDQYLLNGQMNKLMKVQVCIWSFHCIFNTLGETCLTGHVDLMMKQESKRGSSLRQPRLSFLSSLVSTPSFLGFVLFSLLLLFPFFRFLFKRHFFGDDFSCYLVKHRFPSKSCDPIFLSISFFPSSEPSVIYVFTQSSVIWHESSTGQGPDVAPNNR